MSQIGIVATQEADGSVTTAAYFTVAYVGGESSAQGSNAVFATFSVWNGAPLCAAKAALTPALLASAVACPNGVGASAAEKCVFVSCKNSPGLVPAGDHYIGAAYGVCPASAASCPQGTFYLQQTFASPRTTTTSTTTTTVSTTTTVTEAPGPTVSGGATMPSQQNEQKGVASDYSVQITVPIVLVVAVGIGVFVFFHYRKKLSAKRKLHNADLAVAFQSFNNVPPALKAPVTEASYIGRIQDSARRPSNLSHAPLISAKDSVKSVSSSSTSLANTPIYVDDESESTFGSSVDVVQFGGTTSVSSATYQANSQIHASTAYPPAATVPMQGFPADQLPLSSSYPGYYDQYGNYYFFNAPNVPIQSLMRPAAQAVAPSAAPMPPAHAESSKLLSPSSIKVPMPSLPLVGPVPPPPEKD
ncbi:hypothetical protein BC830DRAFT_1170303 [Chytriomyces sp. MP71]|nr:hypothetical protein BC830DRAFT_1170303 [Chytriomyces sp. MP71]